MSRRCRCPRCAVVSPTVRCWAVIDRERSGRHRSKRRRATNYKTPFHLRCRAAAPHVPCDNDIVYLLRQQCCVIACQDPRAPIFLSPCTRQLLARACWLACGTVVRSPRRRSWFPRAADARPMACLLPRLPAHPRLVLLLPCWREGSLTTFPLVCVRVCVTERE